MMLIGMTQILAAISNEAWQRKHLHNNGRKFENSIVVACQTVTLVFGIETVFWLAIVKKTTDHVKIKCSMGIKYALR